MQVAQRAELAPKKYLVTGSRRGIGRAIVETLLQRGHGVFGCSLNDTDLKHPNYTHLVADVSKADQVQALFDRLRLESSSIDACINCAGVAGMNHILLTPPEQVRKIIETNLLGAFNVTQEAARAMSQTGGLIVHFSTIAVRLNLEGECAYAASKAGVEAVVKIAAKELETLRVRVNAIALGPVDTDLIRNVPKKKIDDLLKASHRTKMITREEIFEVIEFFTRNTETTGQIVDL